MIKGRGRPDRFFCRAGAAETRPGNPAHREHVLYWLDMCFQHLTRIDVAFVSIANNGKWILSERIDDHIRGDRHMPLPVMNASRIVDGKIKLFRDYYDRETVKELGIL